MRRNEVQEKIVATMASDHEANKCTPTAWAIMHGEALDELVATIRADAGVELMDTLALKALDAGGTADRARLKQYCTKIMCKATGVPIPGDGDPDDPALDTLMQKIRRVVMRAEESQVHKLHQQQYRMMYGDGHQGPGVPNGEVQVRQLTAG